MASQYFAILTDYGTTAFANALSSKQPLQLTTFAVGDGNGQAVTPTANRTALAREKHRAPVSAVSLDPRNKKQVIVELTIPENVGGFYIREMGVFDNQNKLVAYANCPESFKPTESSGSGKVQVLRMILKVSSSNAVTLSIDHSVIFVTRQQLNPKTITAATQNGFDETGHTHEIDRATTAKAGIVQLSNDDNSDDETKAPTLKAIKKLKGLYDGLRRLLDSYIPNSKKSNATNSASGDTVATSAAVKSANDNANSRVSKSGDTMTGDLSIKNGEYSKLKLYNASGKEFRFESTPDSSPFFGKASYRSEDGATEYHAQYFPKKSGTIALTNEVIFNSGNQSVRGILKAENVGGAWAAYQWGAKQGFWQLEVHPDSHTAGNRRFNMLWSPDTGARVYLGFPHIGDNGETVAYQSWVNTELQKVRSIANQNSQNFNNYIHNSKKSNAVDSNSTDTVASSRAVKLAFDRGTTALNVANEAVHFNRNYFAGDLNSLNDKHEICYLEQAQTKNRNFPSNAYQWGILHVYSNGTLGSQVYYADNGELWGRTRWQSHDWNNWKRLDGIDNVSKSGDTMTGNLTIDTADSLLKGKRNGTNKYAIGLRNSSSDDAIFVNYTYDTALELLRDSVRSNKTLISTGMIIENSDYAGLNLKNLSNRYVRIEGNPHSAANMLTFAYREANGSNINVVGLPRKSGTVALLEDMRNVNRRDYNRTIKGTNDWDNGKQKNIAISGQVITYPDGRIQQIFHLKHFRMTWFAWEDHNIGYNQGSRGVEIFLQLWSAMPSKIINIQVIGSRSTNANTSASFCNEAGEFVFGWNLRKQGNNKDRIWINTARLAGGQDEFMDLYVVVEGY
ncbi:phage tail-collar fiber domain-containing protein [Rodentibacter ratti]|uniref:phage tail-collar fiber domain-containing protein n=1 Tax=Rodentibacter ratti TaxID=1906745 RepID=UPI000984AC68|nr:phage tail protein [Rodentibacter ratti]